MRKYPRAGGEFGVWVAGDLHAPPGMNFLKGLVAALAAGVIVIAFRDPETGGWLPLGGRPGEADADTPEPFLGYDGMDRDTLIDFIGSSDLDQAMLLRVQAYEMAHLARQPVLDAIDDLLG